MMDELPAPLAGMDCDMRGLPSMPLDVVRVIDSDLFALSTGDEFKAAFTLWAKSWNQLPAGSLPDDDRVLSHLSGAREKWASLKDVALLGWVKCSDGRLYHPKICEAAFELIPKNWEELRLRVFDRDGYRCVYCGSREGPFECDHYVARSRGGPDTFDNLKTACRECNRSKGAKSFQIWRAC